MKNTPPSAQTEWEKEFINKFSNDIFYGVATFFKDEHGNLDRAMGKKVLNEIIGFISKTLASERTRLLSVESMKDLREKVEKLKKTLEEKENAMIEKDHIDMAEYKRTGSEKALEQVRFNENSSVANHFAGVLRGGIEAFSDVLEILSDLERQSILSEMEKGK